MSPGGVCSCGNGPGCERRQVASERDEGRRGIEPAEEPRVKRTTTVERTTEESRGSPAVDPKADGLVRHMSDFPVASSELEQPAARARAGMELEHHAVSGEHAVGERAGAAP